MKHLSEFLTRFKNLGLNERLTKEVIAEAANLVFGSNLIKKEDVSISGTTAFIKTKSTIKSEIVLRKGEILKLAKEKGSSVFNITDIR